MAAWYGMMISVLAAGIVWLPASFRYPSERRKDGQLPACVNICPNEALLFGTRSEILRIAKHRIKRKSDVYIDHIYGELEIGGTSWMYIASKKFDQLKMPPLGNNIAPGISEAIQHGIFAYFVPPVTLYALLGTLMWVTKRRNEESQKEQIENSNTENHEEVIENEKGEKS